ncbi:MAG: T9SS C-terminal target domain-containing protein, partial [Chitinivibrionales bacterium]|nr:T9SS C-terminal target domain-containing protein [Chitinivibrionales bacterium]MBD3357206.1 T9SS C-terminal target domain-containing protein [Chitinivibrionales bacterium]
MRIELRTAVLAVMMCALNGIAEVITVDEDIVAPDSAVWTSGNTYWLTEKIFVEEGASLTIEPGVVVKSDADLGFAAAGLVVCRGAKIYAEGTVDSPIVFTSIEDQLEGGGSATQPAPGSWGGVIIMGNARINRPGGQGRMEGIDPADNRCLFGGDDDDDNSGVFRYVSIRFAGIVVSGDKEINGLSMGGVGRGTTIDHVEVYKNFDDGFEWWGGCVNTSHLLAVSCNDDAFDYDEGFRGHGQFWCAIVDNWGPSASTCGEHDGGVNGADTPYAIPVISNATYISEMSQFDHPPMLLNFREGAGGKYLNSIFYCEGFVEIRDEARDRLFDGDLWLKNNIFWASESVELSSWDRIDSWFTDSLEQWNNIA